MVSSSVCLDFGQTDRQTRALFVFLMAIFVFLLSIAIFVSCNLWHSVCSLLDEKYDDDDDDD